MHACAGSSVVSFTLSPGYFSPLPMFSNPATSIMSLEAAVRHDLGAMTVATPVQEGTGLSLARAVIVAVTQTVGSLQQSEEGAGSNSLLSSCEQGTLLQYISDSRKSPALLLLLLSCMKQLQHSCQRLCTGVPQGCDPGRCGQ